MNSSNFHKVDLKDCVGILLKNKNKGLTFDEWKNKKLLEASKAIQIGEAEICFVKIFERMVRKANKESLSNWLKMKNAEAKKIGAKHRKDEVFLNMGARELETLKKNYSNKAFKNWLKIKEKENREKNLRMKKDEACCNMLDECFYLVKSEYNKKAVKDWLHYLKARHK